MKTMAAVVRESGGAFALEELELDDLRPNEVRVRLVATGVCHTDAVVRDQIYPTPLPAVLGHEGAGVVTEIGSAVTTVAPGDRVVLSVNSCGTCRHCLSGHGTYCTHLYDRNFGGRRPDGSTAFTDADGGAISSHFFGQSSFAAHTNADERSVVKVPDDVPLELMGPLGCGVQTGAGAVINSLRPEAGTSFAVFGAGAVGLSALLGTIVVGVATRIVVDVNPDRLALATELGATHVINAREEDAVARIREITGDGVDYALETTGVSPVLRQAVDALGVRGTVGVVGAEPPGTETAFETGLSMTRGWSLKMIIEGDAVPQVFIPQLIDLWRQGRFPFERLVERYPLDRIDEAEQSSLAGGVVKPVLVPG